MKFINSDFIRAAELRRGVREPCSFAMVFITLVAGLLLWAHQGELEARELVQQLDRRDLSVHVQTFVLQAKQSIYVAATDCTFALISRYIRNKAEEPSLRGRVGVVLQQEGRCRLEGIRPIPLPYTLHLRDLEPLRVDETKNIMYRREFIIVDEINIIIVLSDMDQYIPGQFVVYQADLSQQDDAEELIRGIGENLWPSMFPAQPKGEIGREVRWSTTNHKHISRAVLQALGFAEIPISLVEEGNVYVDRLSNFFNNPQHSMRNIGQRLLEAQLEANEWVESRKKLAINEAVHGNLCCALFSLGQGLHTIQDRKHNWIFLYQHLLRHTRSDFWHQYAAEEWETAHRETEEWCVALLNELGRLGGPTMVQALKQTTEFSCRCEEIEVSVKR